MVKTAHNQQLESVLDAVNAAVITIDHEGTIMDANAVTFKLFRYARTELIGQNVRMLMPNPYQKEHDGYLKKHLLTGENKIIGIGRKVTGLQRDGTTFPMHLSVAKYSKDGKTYFTGIVHDLTELEKAQTTNARMGRVMDESLNEIFLFDAETLRFTMVNRGALTNLGYTLEEMQDMTPDQIKPLISDDAFQALINPLLAGNTDRIHFQTLHERKDRSRYDVDVTIHLSDAIDPPEFVAIIQDVTERNKLVEELRQSQKMEAIGQLTGGISHDFNNMLTVIMGNLELASARVSDNQVKELLEEATAAAQKSAKLTNRLLAFSRKSLLEPKKLNPNNLILSLSDLLQRTLGENITLSLVLSPDLWETDVDTSALENALINLAINARDAMPEGGMLSIETKGVTIRRDSGIATDLAVGDYIVISVSDTGTGIPVEIQQQIFEPFFSTKDKQQGTGLGLSMVYGFARQSGGIVTVDSKMGTGSKLSIYLPRSRDNSGSQLDNQFHIASAQTTQKQILVVEDEASVRKLTVRRLQQLGHRVFESNDGPEALALFKSLEKVDLVITDMVMTQDMTGLDLATQLKEIDPSTNIIISSGYSEELLDPIKIREAGIELLPKPYQQSELETAITSLFDSS